jgi:hypothetical protein
MEEVVVMGWAAVTEGVTNLTRVPKMKLEGGTLSPLPFLTFFNPFRYVSKIRKRKKIFPYLGIVKPYWNLML